MKILFVTPGFVHPLVGGQSIRTYNFLRELRARGASITVVTIVEPGSNGQFLRVMEEFGCRVIPVAMNPDRSMTTAEKIALRLRQTPATICRYFDPAMQLAVQEALRDGAFDAVLCDQLHMAQYCHDIPLPKILNTDDPLFIQLRREANVCASRSKAWSMRLEAAKYERYERCMFAAFDHVLFVSAADRKQVEDTLGCRNIEIIPQGVDTSFFTPEGPGLAPPPAEPFVAITGTMNYAPNAAAAVYFAREVLPRLRSTHPRIGCAIVGAYPTEEVKNLARDHQGVVVTGFVDDIRPYLRSASVYVSPAISGTGIKNKVLQAMAMEKGIVATPLSMDGIPQAVDGESVVVAEGADAIARAVARLLDDPAEAARLGANARRCIVEHYSWRAIIGRLHGLLGQRRDA